MRGLYLRGEDGEFHLLISQCFLENIPPSCYFYITAAYDSYAFNVFEMWILLCNAAREEENIQMDIFWLVVGLQLVVVAGGGGLLIQYNE